MNKTYVAHTDTSTRWRTKELTVHCASVSCAQFKNQEVLVLRVEKRVVIWSV